VFLSLDSLNRLRYASKSIFVQSSSGAGMSTPVMEGLGHLVMSAGFGLSLVRMAPGRCREAGDATGKIPACRVGLHRTVKRA